MKRVIALMLVLIMSLGVFASCARDENDKGAMIKMYLGSFPESLDPTIMQMDSEITKFLGLIFEPLTRIDENGKVQPALAKNWYSKVDAIDGEYKIVFELVETRWSDGIGVRAEDVVYAWRRILEPETESPYASLLFPIKNAKEVKSGVMTTDKIGIEASGDYELQVTFNEEYDLNLFAETVACIGLSPLRENIVSKDVKNWASKSTTIVTNGPFRLSSIENGKTIVLERSSYYRIIKDEAFDKYVKPYRIIVEFDGNDKVGAEFQEEQFDAGNTFYLGNFTKEGYEKYGKDVKTTKQLSSYNYYFNTTNSLFSDAKTRQALSAALDRNEIAKIVGRGVVPATGFVPHGVFDTTYKTEFRAVAGNTIAPEANISEANRLLSEAGASKGSFTISYYASKTNTVEKAVAEYAKSVWEGLGYTVNLEELRYNQLRTKLYERDFDVLGLDIIGNMTDAFGYLAPYARYYSGSVVSIDLEAAAYTPHYTGIESQEYDDLIDSIVNVTDLSERAGLLHNAEKKLVELMPSAPLYFNVDSYIISKSLSGLKTSYFGFKDLTMLKLKGYLEINAAIEDAKKSTGTSE